MKRSEREFIDVPLMYHDKPMVFQASSMDTNRAEQDYIWDLTDALYLDEVVDTILEPGADATRYNVVAIHKPGTLTVILHVGTKSHIAYITNDMYYNIVRYMSMDEGRKLVMESIYKLNDTMHDHRFNAWSLEVLIWLTYSLIRNWGAFEL